MGKRKSSTFMGDFWGSATLAGTTSHKDPLGVGKDPWGVGKVPWRVKKK